MGCNGRLEGKTVIITGAASGIGQAIAMRFAEENCAIGLLDINQENLQHTETLIQQKGATCVSYPIDATHRKSVEQCIANFCETFGKCSLLVNCAGIFFGSPFEELTDRQWEKIINVNLTSYFLTCQVVIKQWLSKNHAGVIINIGSVSGERSNAGAVHYCITKAGVASLSRGIAIEYGDRGIRAITLAPGFTSSPLTKSQMDDPATLAKWRSHIPMKRLAEPYEIANAALFLASDEASYITGQTYFVDGGYLLV